MIMDGALINVTPTAVSGAVDIPEWSAGLTAKEMAFVEHWIEYRNWTQAYDSAFDARGGKYETRRDNGYRLGNSPKIQAAIKGRLKVQTEDSGASVAWLLKRLLAIAWADPRELIGLKVGCCRYCHGEGFGYQWREREYMEEMDKVERQARLKPQMAAELVWPDIGGGFDFDHTRPPNDDCPQCRGEGVERFVPRDTDKMTDDALLLYGGIKVKKDGYEIIIADQAKALELAGRIMGAFKDGLRIDGAVAHLHKIEDLRGVDPAKASRVYQDFIAGKLQA